MDTEKLKSILESMLLASEQPQKIERLAKAAGVSSAEVENALLLLENDYTQNKRGFGIVRNRNEIQLTTNPENAAYVEQLIKDELQESLSQAALEVLSIVAYRGPITRTDIESIRGVNSSFTLRNLLLRGLVDRKINPQDARSYVYEISMEFIKYLGISKVSDLPDFDLLSKDQRVDFATAKPDQMENKI